MNDVNKLLARGYQVHCKDYSAQRTRNLTKSVKEWYRDPLHGDREVGWVTLESEDYVRPVRRIALRFKKANGQWGEAVIISTLPSLVVQELAGEALDKPINQEVSALAYVHFYDQRGKVVQLRQLGPQQPALDHPPPGTDWLTLPVILAGLFTLSGVSQWLMRRRIKR